MPASTITKRRPSFSFTYRTRVSMHPRRGHQRAPRLQDQGQGEARDRREDHVRQGRGVRVGASLVVDPQASPEVDRLQLEALVEERPAEVGEGARRGGQGGQVHDLGAEVALHAHDPDPRARAGAAQDVGRMGDRHAELGLAQAGGDVGVGAGIDVGVHPQRDPRLRARGRRPAAPSRAISSSLSALNSPMPRSRPSAQLVVGLADPGEDDPLRRKARPQGGQELPPETMSAPAPRSARRRRIAPLPLAFTA